MEKISSEARRELVHAVGGRYREGTREEKRRILDEFVALTRWHRKHAIRVLNMAGVEGESRPIRTRPRVYDDAIRQAMLTLWEAADRICGKRLRPLLPTLVGALEQHGHLRLDDSVRAKVLGASAATIDRLLAEPRAVAQGRVLGRRAAPSVRRSVPVRTFADWKEPEPGYMEADLVAHCGDTVEGSFAHTLVLTDIATTWTECVPIVVRDGTLIVEALDRLRETMPFRLRGVDTDNGSEFINEAMVAFCTKHGITEGTKERLKAAQAAVDPLRLLDEIRAAQHQIAALDTRHRGHLPAVVAGLATAIIVRKSGSAYPSAPEKALRCSAFRPAKWEMHPNHSGAKGGS